MNQQFQQRPTGYPPQSNSYQPEYAATSTPSPGHVGYQPPQPYAPVQPGKRSKGGKALTVIGTVMMVIGGLLFALPFLVIPVSMMSFGNPPSWLPAIFHGPGAGFGVMPLAFVGFFLLGGGQALRAWGRKTK